MYDPQSSDSTIFISHDEVTATLAEAEAAGGDRQALEKILHKAEEMRGLTHREAAALLECRFPDLEARVFDLARRIKERIYGRRIVMFAPLYLSNYCVNGCVYCPYHASNRHIARRRLTQDEIMAEVIALQDMGHKRIAVEAGEHPVMNPLDYILESIETIYSVRHRRGAVRRVNVNIAATTVDDYRRLHDAGIGTYILFQETYNKEIYERLHPAGPKSDYRWHTEAMDRAMEGGIDDVGLGVLYGLNTYRYDFTALLMHAEHLEARFGVGPHTISVPRICPADGVDAASFEDAVPDDLFARLVAVLRVAVPYTGLIVSTRESAAMRARLLEAGVSQLSGGSRTGVGAYTDDGRDRDSAQFDLSDRRTLDEVVEWLLDCGHIPSFCTACYRSGRTGDRFMALAKSGRIAHCCAPNALMTLAEYLHDYAGPAVRVKGEEMIRRCMTELPTDRVREITRRSLESIAAGTRDICL